MSTPDSVLLPRRLPLLCTGALLVICISVLTLVWTGAGAQGDGGTSFQNHHAGNLIERERGLITVHSALQDVKMSALPDGDPEDGALESGKLVREQLSG